MTRVARGMPRQWVKKKRAEYGKRERTRGWQEARLEGKSVVMRPRGEPLMCLHFLPEAQSHTAGH